MKTYRIMNRYTKEWWEGEATNAQEACGRASWPVKECWIREGSGPKCGAWKKVREEVKEK